MGDTISRCFNAPEEKDSHTNNNKNANKTKIKLIPVEVNPNKTKKSSSSNRYAADGDGDGDDNNNNNNDDDIGRDTTNDNLQHKTRKLSSTEFSPKSNHHSIYDDFFNSSSSASNNNNSNKVSIFGDDNALISLVPISRNNNNNSKNPLSSFYCAVGSEEGEIALYCPATRRVVCQTKTHNNEISHLRYNTNSRLLYGSSRDRKISIHQVAVDGDDEAGENDNNLLQHKLFLEGHTLSVTAMDTRQDDPAFLVSGSRDNTVRLWNCERGECVDLADVKLNIVHCIKWIPALNCVAQGGEDLAIRLWDIRGSSSRNNQSLNLASEMMGFDYHPICCDVVNDGVGHTLVVGHNGFNDTGSTISFWDLRMKKLLRHCEGGHSNTVRRICASQTTSMVVTGSDDQSLKLWSSSPSGEEQQQPSSLSSSPATNDNTTSNPNNNNYNNQQHEQDDEEQQENDDEQQDDDEASSPLVDRDSVLSTCQVSSRVSTLASFTFPQNSSDDDKKEIIVAGFRDGEISAWSIESSQLNRLKYLA